MGTFAYQDPLPANNRIQEQVYLSRTFGSFELNDEIMSIMNLQRVWFRFPPIL